MAAKTIKKSICFWVVGLTLGLGAISNGQTEDKSTAPLSLIEKPYFMVEASSTTASKLILIKNSSPKPVKIRLYAGDFKSQISGRELGTKITFTRLDANEARQVLELAQPLLPGNTLFVKAEVTNLWEAGESEAALYNDGIKIGTLAAVKYLLPFKVKLSESQHEGLNVSLQRNRSTSIFLKNDDPMTYPVKWELSIDSIAVSGSERVVLTPNEITGIKIIPSQSWFNSWFGGFFKPKTKDGILTLTFQPSEGQRMDYSQKKTIPLHASLNYWPQFWAQFVSTLIVFLTLFLGGICSLLLSYWVPNRLQRIDLKEKLAVLARKTRSLSYLIESSLRVLVRVERYRLDKMLDSRWIFSPQLASVFSQCNQGVERLRKQIELLEQIDSINHKLAHAYSSNPLPTLIREIEELLNNASHVLKRTELQEENLQAAQTLIAEAHFKLDKYGKTDSAFAQELAGRIKRLRAEFDSNSPLVSTQTYRDILQRLPGPFKVLVNNYSDPANIFHYDYNLLDINTTKISMIRDFILLVENLPQGKFVAEHQDQVSRFLDSLSLGSWHAIRESFLLIRQMKEGIYPQDVEKAIRQGDKAVSIDIDPGLVRVNQPVQLMVSFRRDDLNRSAASEEFEFAWRFILQKSNGAEKIKAAELTEKGKQVSHFFSESKKYDVEVGFLNYEGQFVADGSGNQIVLKKTIQIESARGEKIGHRTKIEGLYLAIGLFIVFIGLLAGAKEQMLKLDPLAGIIAVFLLGYGTDQIKNLISPHQSDSQPK